LISVVLIVVAITAIAGVVYVTGGTQYAYPYLILLPVIYAAAVFKLTGGVAAAVAAALALGPWMPLDADSGTMQEASNWLVRLGMYVLIAGFVALMAAAYDHNQKMAQFINRIDPVSGLISATAVRQLLAQHDSRKQLGYAPGKSLVIGFEGYDKIVLAMGMEVGDRVIRRLGNALNELAENKYLVTRLHGATFGMLLPANNDLTSRVISRIGRVVPRFMRIENVPMVILPRYGVSDIDAEELKTNGLFRRALVALDYSSEQGRRVTRFRDFQDEGSRDNLALLSMFRQDLNEGMLEVHFQPKMDLGSGRVVGAESLIRWNSAKLGAVSPGRFVPLVEKTMLIDDLTRFVVDQTMQSLRSWESTGMSVSVSINLSIRNLYNPRLVDGLLRLPAEYAVPARRIEFEITESALAGDLNTVTEVLHKLREAGYSLAMDDFGTGYSSLSYLKNMPFDWVKLDQSFVRDLPENQSSRGISLATVSMCKQLDLKVLAEGAETTEAISFLAEHGFDAVQGYHLARPMPASDFKLWLKNRRA